MTRTGIVLLLACLTGRTIALAAEPKPKPKPGDVAERRGDELVVCGQWVHTTAPVVLWLDPGGYDAYRLERRFALATDGAPPTAPQLRPRYGTRQLGLSPDLAERVRDGGWDLPLLREYVDQLVIHFDARGTSRKCFEVLHDVRGLSAHFLLDLDGTIYQTLDLKESAWHATTSNARSIGIEIANIGAYLADGPAPFARWYSRDGDGKTRLLIPPGEEPKKARLDPNWVARPIRPDPITGVIQGQTLRQIDFTSEQYDSLARLTATLCTLFPKIRCDYPRDARGVLLRHKLSDDDLKRYQGLLGHYHVQTNKVDPGPAFQWDKLVEESRALMAR